MAWVREKPRATGGTSYLVRWRDGGKRDGKLQAETFAGNSNEVNKRKAEDFAGMVRLAGERWPEGWVKGRGFVRLLDEPEPEIPVRDLLAVGLEYVNQIVDCGPAQRKRYKSQLQILQSAEVIRADGVKVRPFAGPIGALTEDDVKLWLIQWRRSIKTKANYHGLLFGVFTYAREKGLVSHHPLTRTAPKRSKIRASQGDLRFLREVDFGHMMRLAQKDIRDLLQVEAGTGLRYSEIAGLWVSDVDLENMTLRINKAWKREGEDGEHDTPPWLARLLRVKHTMRGHYLGNPKTPKSKRTITISPSVAKALERSIEGKLPDDFVFTSPTGKSLHQSEFYEDRWIPLLGELSKVGIPPLRFHDLRHTHVAWLVAGGVPLPHIQARLGHESITTTIDTYGHLLPQGDDLINQAIERALFGQRIRPIGLVLSETGS
jgi:integrase